MEDKEALYLALAAPMGILVTVSDQDLAINRFYAARRKLGDPELSCLQFRREGTNQVWISKQGAKPNV